MKTFNLMMILFSTTFLVMDMIEQEWTSAIINSIICNFFIVNLAVLRIKEHIDEKIKS
jgi:hypothetical protein